MVLGKRYDKSIEEKWQAEWDKYQVYLFDENDRDRPVYVIDTPPPFTSGKLHMGHVLSYSYFDFAARYKRMRGYNVYYPQGWDCQGFPTEVKVEKAYGKSDTKTFITHCIRWTNDMITKMKSQMKRMGFSPDWRYEYRTMDKNYHRLVQLSLIKMFDKGDMYSAEHPVLWCPRCESAIAKAETEEVERDTELHYIKFLHGTEAFEIATTRPELLHACVAVMFNPEDERYKHLEGKTIVTPLGKEVPVIADQDVDKEFGTGLVMVCTFGDKQDVVWTYRHNLPVIKAFDQKGRVINSGIYDGLPAKEARKKVLDIIKEKGLYVRSEPLRQVVKIHDRCGTTVEFLMSKQWFLNVKDYKDMILKSANEIRWYPEFGIYHLINWTKNLEWDWVISRQRVWGTPIPFWYCPKCKKWYHADESELPVDPRFEKRHCPVCGTEMEGETAVCDCWVDSSITPLVISKWTEDEEFFNRMYPATLRPQGYEIIRTWAFYTIYRCKYLTGKTPFKEILLNGNVLAPDGTKMSKSKKNEIEPNELLDEYSADALRQWAALSGAMTKDKPFSYKDIKYSQSFLNKLWNAARFMEPHISEYDYDDADSENLRTVDRWILSRLFTVIKEVTMYMDKYEYQHALRTIQTFFWHEVCDYYIEYVKHRLYDPEKYGIASKRAAQYTLYNILLTTIKLLAPFTPHISEEIYQIFYPEPDKFVVRETWPEPYTQWFDPRAVQRTKLLNKVVARVREYRGRNGLSMKQPIPKIVVRVSEDADAPMEEFTEEIEKVCNVGSVVIERVTKDTLEDEVAVDINLI